MLGELDIGVQDIPPKVSRDERLKAHRDNILELLLEAQPSAEVSGRCRRWSIPAPAAALGLDYEKTDTVVRGLSLRGDLHITDSIFVEITEDGIIMATGSIAVGHKKRIDHDKVLAVLQKEPDGMHVQHLATALGCTDHVARKTLGDMCRSNKVYSVGQRRGKKWLVREARRLPKVTETPSEPQPVVAEPKHMPAPQAKESAVSFEELLVEIPRVVELMRRVGIDQLTLDSQACCFTLGARLQSTSRPEGP